MRKNKVVKPVSFNITNEKDQAVLDKVQDMNFSGYVKELILADIRREKIKAVHKSVNGGFNIVLG